VIHHRRSVTLVVRMTESTCTQLQWCVLASALAHPPPRLTAAGPYDLAVCLMADVHSQKVTLAGCISGRVKLVTNQAQRSNAHYAVAEASKLNSVRRCSCHLTVANPRLSPGRPRRQELSCCWDGRESRIFAFKWEHLSSMHSFSVISENIAKKTRNFWAHLCR